MKKPAIKCGLQGIQFRALSWRINHPVTIVRWKRELSICIYEGYSLRNELFEISEAMAGRKMESIVGAALSLYILAILYARA